MGVCVFSICAWCNAALLLFGFLCECLLTRTTAASYFNVVDLYNSATGTWSTAQLSVARWYLAATSVGNVAIFAGGDIGSVLMSNGSIIVRVLLL